MKTANQLFKEYKTANTPMRQIKKLCASPLIDPALKPALVKEWFRLKEIAEPIRLEAIAAYRSQMPS